MSLANDRLQLYLAAEKTILAGQESSMNGLRLRMPDLPWVQSQIVSLQRQVDTESRTANGGSSLRHQLPDFT